MAWTATYDDGPLDGTTEVRDDLPTPVRLHIVLGDWRPVPTCGDLEEPQRLCENPKCLYIGHRLHHHRYRWADLAPLTDDVDDGGTLRYVYQGEDEP